MKFNLLRNKSIASNRFYKNIFIVASGNVTAKLITVLLSPIITRLYTPNDFGLYSTFISVIGISGSLATLRYAVTIPLSNNNEIADNVLKLCFIVTFFLSLFWLAIICFFGVRISNYYQTESLLIYLWIIPIVFFGKGIYEALTHWAIRCREFKLITKTKIKQSVFSSFVKIIFGLIGIKPLGLFLGFIVDETAGIYNILKKLLIIRPAFFKELNLIEIKSVAIRYKKFPLVQSWSQLLLATCSHLPVIFLGMFYSFKIVGIFGLANSTIRMPVDLIGMAVSQVYFAEISKLGKNNPVQIYRLTISLLKKLFLIGLIPISIIVIFGPWLFSMVFGAQWYDAGTYARLLSISILTGFSSAPVGNVFNVYERMDLQLKLNGLRILMVLFVFSICYYFNLSAIVSIGVFSSCMTIYFVFFIFVILKLIKSNFDEIKDS